MPKKRKFKYGIFDRDGVLIDSFAAHDDLFTSIVKQLKIRLLAPEKVVMRKDCQYRLVHNTEGLSTSRAT